MIKDLSSTGKKNAYVSLLYGEEFKLGVRVLGQSLRETTTKSDVNADLVVLVAGHVSQSTIDILQEDGWIVRRSHIVGNPSANHPHNFHGVYTKLLLFGEEQYHQIIFLDADTIVMKNIDPLFLCDGFCAVLRHSERFNSGVMSIQTSQEWMQDMLSLVQDIPSYTGGDQGFLNSYLDDFACAPLFFPDKGERLSEYNSSMAQFCGSKGGHHHPVRHLGRLPTTYNADLGLFVLNKNKWPFDGDDLRVIHYTLGPIKPWQWFSLFTLGREAMEPWLQYRNALPHSGSCIVGTNSFWNGFISLLYRQSIGGWLVVWAILVTLGYQHFVRSIHNTLPRTAPKQAPKTNSAFFLTSSACISYLSIAVSLFMAYSLTPSQMCPWLGYISMVILFGISLPAAHGIILHAFSQLYKYHRIHLIQIQDWKRLCIAYLAVVFLIFYPPCVTLVLCNTLWSRIRTMVILELISVPICGVVFPHTRVCTEIK
jgi:alpha-N-acetylglucosamine transferase